MIDRAIQADLLQSSTYYLVLTVMRPRWCGKTTLCRQMFPDHQDFNLKRPSVKDFANGDPEGFIASCHDGVIIDEVQRSPALLSAIMVDVDESNEPG